MKQENEFKMEPNLNINPQNMEDVPENNDQEEDDLDDDMDDYGPDQQDNDSSDDYGSSGEKYGWYNGFSDDAIDDAFEGDPENTWNVD
jgi:hypothetical protein